MAIYHCNVRVFSRGQGKSSVKEAAYVSGSRFCDAGGEAYDFTKKEGVVYSALHFPTGIQLGGIGADEFWRAVESREKRRDAQLAREVVVALPRELTLEQNKDGSLCQYAL